MKAFDEIYGLYARRLFAFCLKYTKSKENAEEIMEDTFVWLWNNRICLIRVWVKTAFSYFYKEQKKVTRKGTEKSTQKPWKMETMMKLSPE